MQLSRKGDNDEIEVMLDTYVLLSPDNIPLDDKDKEKLQGVIERDPLALIEYWSIDPDYDGETFRSTWQDYRENVDNDNDPLHCVYQARLHVPHKEHRKVCIKAVDVFGFESQVMKALPFIRNNSGADHGAGAKAVVISKPMAKLAVNLAAALDTYLIEEYAERIAKTEE